MHTHHTTVSIDEQLVVSSTLRRNLFITLALGIVFFAIGVLLAYYGDTHGHELSAHAADHGTSHGHSEVSWYARVWAVLWHNSIFFVGISAMGIFFVCVQYVSWAGWSSIFKRVPESFGAFLPFAAISVLLVFIFGHHELFHWTHEYLYDVNSPQYDRIIDGKKGYLNIPFYLTRMIAFFLLWYFIWLLIRKQSLQEDLHGGDTYYHKSGYIAAVFLVIFGATTPLAAWDWVMSIDPHWFSTMFGWYVFASWWVTALATITLITVYLKENGYLKAMNESHFHDLGKLVFAFSIFWTYIWFGQFLLIFYANLPEETIYFVERLKGYNGHYTGLFYFNLIINFFFPFLALMTRDSKRKLPILKIVTIAVIFGHWLDFYMMIMPGVTKGTSGFGMLEFGALLAFASAFILVILNTMSKSKLIPVNHPMIEESLHHNI